VSIRREAIHHHHEWSGTHREHVEDQEEEEGQSSIDQEGSCRAKKGEGKERRSIIIIGEDVEKGGETNAAFTHTPLQ
tara:strand:+ start:513 stop:743 length:231 start_codon:yes stop_codon:yes gene_type:complete